MPKFDPLLNQKLLTDQGLQTTAVARKNLKENITGKTVVVTKTSAWARANVCELN